MSEAVEARPGGSRFSSLAWTVLAVNLAVVLWGALVRATGSGAGCGGHWPLCNGEMLPSAASRATLIEFVHRMGSGLALALVGVEWVWSLRRFSRGHPARRWAWGAMALIIVEALVGAGLVLLGWVGTNASLGRAGSIALHLTITYALLACLALVAWHGAPRRPDRVEPSVSPLVGGILLAGMILVGMSGAVTALGDTLFPPASVGQGLQQDFAAGADFLIRLRVIHPLMAATVAVAGIAWAASRRKAVGPTMARRRLAWLGGVLAVQLVAGLTNVVLLAPVWLQIFHLLLAQTAWLLLIVCLAESPMGLRETPKPAV